MALLRDHQDDLSALTAAAAEALGIDPAFVEKDFWVIEVLRAAVVPVKVAAKDRQSYEVQTIFKGGTSLSRVFGIIERFSEDVDLLISFPQVETSGRARDNVLKHIRDAVAAHLGRAGKQSDVTTGVKRNIRYPYPARFGSGDVTEGVLLEMGSRGGTYPTQQHHLRSMVADFAIESLGEEPDAWEEFEQVPVDVLSPERTLLEKLSLLHDAASRYPDPKARAKLLGGGRHLYDVHQLLTSEPVLAALTQLGRDGVIGLCRDIDAHSEQAEFSFTSRPDEGFGHSPICVAESECQEALRQGHQAAMPLIYGDRPTFDDCIHAISAQTQLL